MSTSELRSASTRIRHDLDFGQAYGDPAFLSAVADWLDNAAEQIDYGSRFADLDVVAEAFANAFAVAHAYLGTEAS